MREYCVCWCNGAAFTLRRTDEGSLSRSVEVSLKLKLDFEAASEIGYSSPRFSSRISLDRNYLTRSVDCLSTLAVGPSLI